MPETRKPTSEPDFRPFADDAAVQSIGGLSIENGRRVVALHGALDLTRDRPGLDRARALRSVLDAIVAALEAQDLPEAVADATDRKQVVKNPFA